MQVQDSPRLLDDSHESAVKAALLKGLHWLGSVKPRHSYAQLRPHAGHL